MISIKSQFQEELAWLEEALAEFEGKPPLDSPFEIEPGEKNLGPLTPLEAALFSVGEQIRRDGILLSTRMASEFVVANGGGAKSMLEFLESPLDPELSKLGARQDIVMEILWTAIRKRFDYKVAGIGIRKGLQVVLTADEEPELPVPAAEAFEALKRRVPGIEEATLIAVVPNPKAPKNEVPPPGGDHN